MNKAVLSVDPKLELDPRDYLFSMLKVIRSILMNYLKRLRMLLNKKLEKLKLLLKKIVK